MMMQRTQQKWSEALASTGTAKLTHPVVVYAIACISVDCGALANWHCASSWYRLCPSVWCNSRGKFVVRSEGIEQVSYHELHEPVHLQATWCDGNREMTRHRFEFYFPYCRSTNAVWRKSVRFDARFTFANIGSRIHRKNRLKILFLNKQFRVLIAVNLRNNTVVTSNFRESSIVNSSDSLLIINWSHC